MSVWLRQVFGLLRVRFRHVSLYSANPSYSFSPPNGNVIPPQTQPADTPFAMIVQSNETGRYYMYV